MTSPTAVRFRLELGSKGRRDAPVRHPAPEPLPEDTSPPADAEQTSPQLPSRAARMLALGYRIERAIEAGELNDYGEAARRFGISRPRLTQITNLTLLSPTIQEAILTADIRASERDLRQLVAKVAWKDREKGLLQIR